MPLGFALNEQNERVRNSYVKYCESYKVKFNLIYRIGIKKTLFWVTFLVDSENT